MDDPLELKLATFFPREKTLGGSFGKGWFRCQRSLCRKGPGCSSTTDTAAWRAGDLPRGQSSLHSKAQGERKYLTLIPGNTVLYCTVLFYTSTDLGPREHCHSYHSPGHSEVLWASGQFPFFERNNPIFPRQWLFQIHDFHWQRIHWRLKTPSSIIQIIISQFPLMSELIKMFENDKKTVPKACLYTLISPAHLKVPW